MTATSDFMTDGQLCSVANQPIDGVDLLLRWLYRIVGVSLILASSGLWIAPGANWSSDVMLIKMGLSALALMFGFWLTFESRRIAQPDIEIDTARRELRVVRNGAMGSTLVVKRCRFADLARVERHPDMLRFWDQSGEFIAEINVTEQRIMDMVVSGLRDSGQPV
jgi:hypothetical protein